MPYNDRLFQLLHLLSDTELTALWTQALRKHADDDDFREVSKEVKIHLLSAEWRSVHGSSFKNLTRSKHELAWKQILIDVADRMKPGIGGTAFQMKDSTTERQLEHIIMRFLEQRTSDVLTARAGASAGNGAPQTVKREAVQEAIKHCLDSDPGATANAGTRAISFVGGKLRSAILAPSTSYSKSLPATLMLLTAVALREELEKLD